MDTSRNRIRRMVGLLWFCFFFAGVLAEGTLEKLHEDRIGWRAIISRERHTVITGNADGGYADGRHRQSAI
ncbi:hypothetical protein ALC56_13710 [Trachymyrmex septentrionalis]|uniref:Uncharacterized protein n=1 Tax=Trachymyrmex septentrionalis TaxID=34720 RepID=A0A195EVM8_9HYME|nr:hypothetical protein ALC56_13710 [Trachymyrmex septentrionalis]